MDDNLEDNSTIDKDKQNKKKPRQINMDQFRKM